MSDVQTTHIDGRSREARAAKAAAEGLSNVDAPASDVSATHEVKAGDRRVTRENRRSFGATTQKLAYPDRPGFRRYWFNDDGRGRIDLAHEAGYTHVRDEKTGKNVSRPVGTKDGGGALIAYLMEIPQDWYDDDCKQLEERNAQVDAAIRSGKVGMNKADPRDGAKFYNSAQGREIKITAGPRP